MALYENQRQLHCYPVRQRIKTSPKETFRPCFQPVSNSYRSKSYHTAVAEVKHLCLLRILTPYRANSLRIHLSNYCVSGILKALQGQKKSAQRSHVEPRSPVMMFCGGSSFSCSLTSIEAIEHLEITETFTNKALTVRAWSCQHIFSLCCLLYNA